MFSVSKRTSLALNLEAMGTEARDGAKPNYINIHRLLH